MTPEDYQRLTSKENAILKADNVNLKAELSRWRRIAANTGHNSVADELMQDGWNYHNGEWVRADPDRIDALETL